MALLDHFNWKRIGIISEKSAVPRGIHDALSVDTLRKGIAIAVEACKITLGVCSALMHVTLHNSYIAMLLSTRPCKRVCTHSPARNRSLSLITRRHLCIPCRLSLHSFVWLCSLRSPHHHHLAPPSSLTPLARHWHRRRGGGGRKAG